MPTPHTIYPRHRRQGGLSLLDLLLATTVLAVALLTQVSGAVTNHNLIEEQKQRSHAVTAAKQVIGHLRSDEDWPGIYDRLYVLQVLAEKGSAPLALYDGGTAWRPQAYFPDFENPPTLDDLGVLVEVPPAAPLATAGGGSLYLREDVPLPQFGLPADLNCDAVIDGEPRDDDYRMLPVIVHVRWRSKVGGFQEMRLATWLRGAR